MQEKVPDLDAKTALHKGLMGGPKVKDSHITGEDVLHRVQGVSKHNSVHTGLQKKRDGGNFGVVIQTTPSS